MLCKTPEIESQLKTAAVHPKIKAILAWLDAMVDLCAVRRPPALVVTDLISTFRTGPSCHPYGAAADVRTVDWSSTFRSVVEAGLLALKILDPKIHFRFEDKPGDSAAFTGAHLHLQYGMAADYAGKEVG